MDPVEADAESTGGLQIVVDGEYVVTAGLSTIDHREIQMRISPLDEIADLKTILLRIATYIVSCHTRLREDATLDLGAFKVQIQSHYSGRLEIKRLSGR